MSISHFSEQFSDRSERAVPPANLRSPVDGAALLSHVLKSGRDGLLTGFMLASGVLNLNGVSTNEGCQAVIVLRLLIVTNSLNVSHHSEIPGCVSATLGYTEPD